MAILVIISGCSTSDSQINTTANVTNPLSSNSTPANSNGASMTNASTMQPYGGIKNVNLNAFNATSDNLKVVNVAPKKELPYGQRNAPDDSVISSGSRGKEFFEVRTFKGHPTLAKVEKIMDGVTTKYKVYLKNGKVIDAPTDQMSNYAAMAPESILSVVGAQPPAPNSSPSNGGKKEQKEQ